MTGADAPARWRRGLALLVLLALIVLIGSAIGAGGRGGRPLDPRSTARDGTRAILDVLRELGVEVVVSPLLVTDAEVVLVIEDRLDAEQHNALSRHIADGGRLVLADPFSDLAPTLVGEGGIGFTEPTITPECDDPAVRGVDRVAVDQSYVFRAEAGDSACFPRAGGHWMLRRPAGAGEVISLGGGYSFTNDLVDNADTAVLLVALLTPSDGGALVVLEPRNQTVGGEDTLSDLLPTGVTVLFVQLPLAWLALVWWRARRDGRLVVEDPPVKLEASEQTSAFGRLLGTARLRGPAASIVRAEVIDRLQRRVGVGDGQPVEAVVQIAAARTQVDPALLTQVLTAAEPADDGGLLDFTSAAAAVLRQLDAPARAPGGGPDPDVTARTPEPTIPRSTS